jgi:hypothetical protein
VAFLLAFFPTGATALIAVHRLFAASAIAYQLADRLLHPPEDEKNAAERESGGVSGSRRAMIYLTEYFRSPSSTFLDVTTRPIFLPSVPDRNPRTECGCQPVAFINSLTVAPLGRFNRSRILAVLLPARTLAFVARLGAFLVEAAFFPDLALLDATWRARLPTLGFLEGFGSVVTAGAVPGCSVVDVMFFSWAVITADDVSLWSAPKAREI